MTSTVTRLKLVPFTLALVLSGCAATDFAKTNTPASVKEEWIRNGVTVWGGTRIYAIGELEFGYRNDLHEITYKVDAGPKSLKVWYYANRGNAKGLLWQTDPVELAAQLKPNGRYEVRGIYGEDEVSFVLFDLDASEIVGTTPPARVVRRPPPFRDQGAIVPILIPGRR